MLIALWAIFILTVAYTLHFYPVGSVVTAATFGLAAYSIPALIGTTHPIVSPNMMRISVATSSDATLAMCIAWLGYFIMLLPPSPTPRVPKGSKQLADRFVTTAVVLCCALFFVMVWRSGPTFFLRPRQEVYASLGYEYLFWVWTNILGLVGAYVLRRYYLFFFFAAMICINLLIGDRTGPVIGLVALLLVFLRGYYWSRALLSWKFAISALTLFTVVFFAKRIYVAVKDPNLAIFELVNPADFADYWYWATSWEAFGIHQILEDVIRYNYAVDFSDVASLVLAQLLILPSAFGFQSSAFTEGITTHLYPYVGYGVAYNYFAQGFALGGFFGVLAYAILFGVAVRMIHAATLRTQGPINWLFVILGAAVAIYTHRNSLENELAVLRQIFLPFTVTYLLAHIFPSLPVARTPLSRQSEMGKPRTEVGERLRSP